MIPALVALLETFGPRIVSYASDKLKALRSDTTTVRSLRSSTAKVDYSKLVS